MATNDDTRFGPGHLDGIRLQAERVVRAYNDLRGTAKSVDFASDDFPVGKFAELFQQLKQLDGWLEPLIDSEDADETADDIARDTAEVLASRAGDAKAEIDERPEITVLIGDHCNAIYGLHGICSALVELDEPESLELAIAARELARRLYGGLGSLLDGVEKRIEQATGMRVRS